MLSLAVAAHFPHSADGLALNLARSGATALGAAGRFEPKPSGLAASDKTRAARPAKIRSLSSRPRFEAPSVYAA